MNLDEIKSLKDPEERLARLKEFEEQSRKEIEEAETLVKQNESELIRQKKLEGIQLPQQKDVHIDDLFGQENQNKLEKTAATAPTAEGKNVEYLIKQDLETLEGFYGNDHLNDYQKEIVAKIEGKISAFKYMNTSQEVNDMLTASSNMIYTMKKYTLG